MIMNVLNGVWSDTYPADHNPRRITKSDKDFAKRLDFKNIKFPVKIKDIHKITKKELHQH